MAIDNPTNSATPPNSGAPSQAGAPSASPAADAAPARDWAKDYSELERKYNEVEAKAKRWDGYDYDQTSQAMNWARQVAQAMQEGRLIDKSQLPSQPSQPAADPFERWDDLTPKEQARLLRESIGGDLSTSIRGEWDGLKKSLDTFQREQQAQLQLAIQSIRMAQENGVPYEELVADATRLAALTPDQLLREALAGKVGPKKQQEEIERQVKERLASELAKRENEEAERLMPSIRTPRFLQRKDNKADWRETARAKILEMARKRQASGE